MAEVAALVAKGLELGLERGWFGRVRRFFQKKRRILVLGAAGTGKTAFVRSLSGAALGASDLFRPTLVISQTRVTLEGLRFVVIDTPGHEIYQAVRRDAVVQGMRRRFDGIMNVVCYGYHEIETPREEVLRADHLRPRAKYLQNRRRVEVEQLLSWRELARPELTPWVMTLVNKADLWREESDAVMRYYESGEYHEGLADLPARVHHMTLPYCATIQTFFGGLTSGRFGDHDRAGLQAYFVKTLMDAAGKERGVRQ